METVARTATLTERVSASIRREIASGRLEPGQVYSAARIAELSGVSRSPAREALLQLAEAGVVEFARNRGFRVVLPDARGIAEIFAIRVAIEAPAAAKLASNSAPSAEWITRALEAGAPLDGESDEEFWRQDIRFHVDLVELAGNRRAGRVIAELRAVTALLGDPTTRGARTPDNVLAEHAAIALAVRAGDPDRARRAMYEHLRSTAAMLVAQNSAVPAEQFANLWNEALLSPSQVADS